MTTLQELFDATNKVGNRYQTEAQRKAFQETLDAINADIIREAVKRGEYDQEKGIWLV
jgi:hypothetical protein